MTGFQRQHVFADEKPGLCACGQPAGGDAHIKTPGAALTRLRAACARIYRQEAGPLTCTHLSELMYIKARGMASPKHLIYRENISQPTAGKAIQRLISYGYLYRTGCHGDMVPFDAVVAPAGHQVLNKILDAAEERAARLTERQIVILEEAAELLEAIAADAPGVPSWTKHERVVPSV